MIDYFTLQKEQVKERYADLPPELKSLIDYGTVDIVLKQLFSEFDFSQEQKILLENEILLVILLLLPIDGLADRIAESVGIKPEKADYITNYCTEQLFNLEADLFTESEELFAENKTDTTPSPVEPLETRLEPVPKHGYGAGLPIEEPLHTSEQSTLVEPGKPSNPQSPSNLNF